MASGAPKSAEVNPGDVVFDTPGLFTVSFTATDEAGLPRPPDTRTVPVVDGSP